MATREVTPARIHSSAAARVPGRVQERVFFGGMALLLAVVVVVLPRLDCRAER